MTETQDQMRERVVGYIKHNAAKDAAGLLDLIQQGHAQVMSSIDGLSAEQSTFKPGPEDWSVLSTIQHVVDGKMGTARLCAALGQGGDAESLGGEGEKVGRAVKKFATLGEARKAAVEAHDALVAFVGTLSDQTDLIAKHPHSIFGPLNCREGSSSSGSMTATTAARSTRSRLLTDSRPPARVRRRRRCPPKATSEVIRKGWEGFAKRDLDGIAAIYHDDVVYHGAADEEIQGRDALIAWVNNYLTAFPDIEAQVEDQVAEGDRVFSRVRTVGTNTGPLMGKAPIGKRVELRWMTLHRFRDGRVAEEWELFDRLDMLSQLGHLSAPGEA